MSDPKDLIDRLAKDLGGTVDEVSILPDGSGFATMSMPLPADHWLTREGFDEPPAPLCMGTGNPLREPLAQMIREVGKYAYRASSMNGKENDIDPDALLQNLVVGLLGYWTDDGRSKL